MPACRPAPAPCTPADSRGAWPLIRARQPGTSTQPAGRTFCPEQAFVCGSRLAEGNGAQGRAGVLRGCGKTSPLTGRHRTLIEREDRWQKLKKASTTRPPLALQMRKQRPGEALALVQGHTTSWKPKARSHQAAAPPRATRPEQAALWGSEHKAALGS